MRGFGLLELILVTLILMLVLASGFGGLARLSGPWQLRMQARQMLRGLQATELQALSSMNETTFRIERDGYIPHAGQTIKMPFWISLETSRGIPAAITFTAHGVSQPLSVALISSKFERTCQIVLGLRGNLRWAC